MNFLRYLLSHGLLILILAALIFTYVYRAQLFNHDVTTQIDGYVDKSLAWLAQFPNQFQTAESDSEAVDKEAETTTSNVDNLAEQASDQETVDTPKEQVAETPEEQAAETPKEQVAETVLSDTNTLTENSQQAAADDNEMPVPAATTEKSVETADVDNTLESDADNTTAESEADSDKTAATASHIELLNNARLAFQNGKADDSVRLYKELSELNPDDPNVFGEMGNVFYSQGKWKEAGLAYYQAASCLLAQGKPEQVPYLYRVIQGLDPESAEKLRSKLAQ